MNVKLILRKIFIQIMYFIIVGDRVHKIKNTNFKITFVLFSSKRFWKIIKYIAAKGTEENIYQLWFC